MRASFHAQYSPGRRLSVADALACRRAHHVLVRLPVHVDPPDRLHLLLKILFQWGAAESSFAGQWLPAAGGHGAWAVRTGSGPMRMCGDIFAAARL
jgi:hypothetical protein